MKSKFFCVAVEGATTDGRTIDAAWIKEMAANYDPATYTANINVEHIRGYSPEKPFNCYGHILALEERTVDLTINGKTEKRAALFAQVEGNDQLVALAKAGQKRFPSIEVNPNFAGKGQAYCVGLGMTDGPASLGTEMLKFAAQAAVNPFTSRKQHADNLFTAADSVEAVLVEFEDDAAAAAAAAGAPQAFSVDAIVAGLKKAFTAAPAAAPAAAAAAAATETPNTDAIVAAFTDALGKIGEGIKAQGEAFAAAQRATDQTLGQLQSDFTSLKTDLSKAPNVNHSARPDATGGDGEIVTDC